MDRRLKTRIARVTVMAALGLVVVGLVLSATPAAATGNPNPGVLPPQSHPYGQAYGEWAADWWTWAVEAGLWPIVDETGEFCTVGQFGPVWFLAGNYGWLPGPYERACEVPAGKALFFPIQNSVWFSFPDDPYIGYPEYPEPGGEDVVRAGLAAANDATGGRSATIDGVAIQQLDNYRVTSPAFGALLPDDSFYAQFGIPGMLFEPNFDDGWYLMLAPLPAGEHTVSFTGADGSVDVTYYLTIVGDE